MEQDVLHSLSRDIEIQQASNHLLILCLVLLCFLLEEVYAPPTQPKGDLDCILFVDQLRWRGKKILDHSKVAQWFVSVSDALFHRFLFLSANTRHL